MRTGAFCEQHRFAIRRLRLRQMDMDFATTIIAILAIATVGHVLWRRVFATVPAAPIRAFPQVKPRSAHWQRATSIVEQSLARASDIVSCQAAAARQLDACDYALHALLAELGDVMNLGVASPLAPRQQPAMPAQAPAHTTAIAA